MHCWDFKRPSTQLPQSTVPTDIDEAPISTLSPFPAFFFETECCIHTVIHQATLFNPEDVAACASKRQKQCPQPHDLTSQEQVYLVLILLCHSTLHTLMFYFSVYIFSWPV
jgi:hypothetical protein